MAPQWHYIQNGQEQGPIDEELLRSWLHSGRLSGRDYIWREGMQDWSPASSIFSESAATPAPPKPPPVASLKPQRPTAPQSLASQVKVLWGAVIALGVLAAMLAFWVANLSLSRQDSAPVAQAPAAQPQPQTTPTTTDQAVAPTTPRPQPTDRQTPVTPSLPNNEEFTAAAPISSIPQAPIAQQPLSNPFTDPPGTAATPDTSPAVVPQEPLVAVKQTPPAEQNPEPPAERGPPKAIDEAHTLFQSVTVSRQPSFVVQGAAIAQQSEYRILSELQIGPRRRDGSREVRQTVKDAKLDKSDQLSRSMLQASLSNLIGKQYVYTLDDAHRVTQFAGPPQQPAAGAVNGLGGQGFMMSSAMDNDGWKELAEMSFLLPQDILADRMKWSREMSHDWGQLGGWEGVTNFTCLDSTPEQSVIDYRHKMQYVPPKGNAGGLPFQVQNAAFQPQKAGGVVRFDARYGRVTSVREEFHVQGAVQTSLLGQASTVRIEEKQQMHIQLSEENPWER